MRCLNSLWRRQRLIACLELPCSKAYEFAVLGVQCTHEPFVDERKVRCRRCIVLPLVAALRRFVQAVGWLSHVKHRHRAPQTIPAVPSQSLFRSHGLFRCETISLRSQVAFEFAAPTCSARSQKPYFCLSHEVRIYDCTMCVTTKSRPTRILTSSARRLTKKTDEQKHMYWDIEVRATDMEKTKLSCEETTAAFQCRCADAVHNGYLACAVIHVIHCCQRFLDGQPQRSPALVNQAGPNVERADPFPGRSVVSSSKRTTCD